MKLILKNSLFVLFACLSHTGCRTTSGEPEASSSCISGITGNSLDIVTWNVHDFPYRGNESIVQIASLITKLNADIIALQEVVSRDAFNRLLAALPGYRGIIDAASDLNLAYLFKKDIRVNYNNVKILFCNDPFDFPRPPFCISFDQTGSKKIILVNIHLKCCDGAENIYRRKIALEKLKKYLDDSLASDRVILLGDFNDEITKESSENVFTSFLEDSLHYRFADLAIADGNPSGWSFPGWPGDLDHFLITDELFNENYSVTCLRPDLCDSLYTEYVSDHRPVLFQLK